MARSPKPWWRKGRKSWFVMLDGKQVNLGPDKKAAHDRFHELMSQPQKRIVASGTVIEIIDRYLDWCIKNRSPGTFEWYRERCQWFVETIPANLTVSAFKPLHVQQWIDGKNCSDGHKRGCIKALQRAFRWAKKQGYIDHDPIANMEKPEPGNRETILTSQEYKDLLGRVKDEDFRNLLVTAWHTGARPQEILAVEARHVEIEGSRWVFPTKESKGKRRPRVVYLNEIALDITTRLVRRFPTGRLFRNSDTAWTKAAVNCRFCRLQQSLGRETMRRQGVEVRDEEISAFVLTLSQTKTSKGQILPKSEKELVAEARRKLTNRLATQHAQKICLYVFRHSFATRMLEAGVDAPIVSAWLGHANLTQLGRTYAHLTSNPLNLLDQLRKAG